MTRRTLVATLAASMLIVGMTASTAFAARPVWVFSTQLTGEAERPGPGDPNAVGHATIRIMPATDTICWTVTWARVDTGEEGVVFASHIHGQADATAPAGVVLPLFVAASFAGQGSHHDCLTDVNQSVLLDQILANPELYYVNVHSTPFGPGAIRGQLQ